MPSEGDALDSSALPQAHQNAQDKPDWLDANFADKCGPNNTCNLTPIPRTGLARLELLQQITDSAFVKLAKVSEETGGNLWGFSHAVPPFSSGMPLQSAVNARWVSLTALIPFDVTLKNRLAL